MFIYLFKRQRQGQEEKWRRESTLMVHFTSGHDSWDWATTKPGARNSIKVSHVDNRNPSYWYRHLLLALFIGRKVDQKQRQDLGCYHPQWQLNSLSPNYTVFCLKIIHQAISTFIHFSVFMQFTIYKTRKKSYHILCIFVGRYATLLPSCAQFILYPTLL